MKKLSIVSAAGVVGLASMAFQTADATVLTGTVRNNANTCPWALLKINNDDCTYNGSNANMQTTYYTPDPWVGPAPSSAFYDSTLGSSGSPSAGDGKVAPNVTANISIGSGNSSVSGTITIGAVNVHNFSAGGSTGRGEESWLTRTLTLTPKAPDFNVDNTLIIGSQGFPAYLLHDPSIAGTFGDDFTSEQGADSNGSTPDLPYWDITSRTNVGIATWEDASVIDNALPGRTRTPGTVASIGTTATQSSTGYSCVDTDLGTSGTGGACASSSALENRGDFENVLLKILTDGAGNVLGIEGFLVQESNSGRNGRTWVAWTFNADTVVPVPAAAWLFGSALGLLGWLRRRSSTTA